MRSLVLISIQTSPGRAPVSTPSARARARRRRATGRQVTTASHCGGDLGRRRREPRPGGDEPVDGGGVEVADDELETGAQQRAGELGAEMSQSDESVNHARSLPA